MDQATEELNKKIAGLRAVHNGLTKSMASARARLADATRDPANAKAPRDNTNPIYMASVECDRLRIRIQNTQRSIASYTQVRDTVQAADNTLDDGALADIMKRLENAGVNITDIESAARETQTALAQAQNLEDAVMVTSTRATSGVDAEAVIAAALTQQDTRPTEQQPLLPAVSFETVVPEERNAELAGL